MPRKLNLLLSVEIMLIFAALLTFFSTSALRAADLQEVKQRGVLRHLGIPYANFVTGSGDGLDVELVKLFAPCSPRSGCPLPGSRSRHR